MIESELSLADTPTPDLFIRTGGEHRISNFMIWQLAYTELVFIDVLWPDFTTSEMKVALDEYARRQRRYGKPGTGCRRSAMLKQRIITACIMASVFIGTILYAPHGWVRIMFAIFLGVSFYELSELTIKPGTVWSMVIGACAATVLLLWGPAIEAVVIRYQSAAGAILWLGVALYFLVYSYSGYWSLATRLFFFVIGVCMLWVCTTSLIYIHGHVTNGGWVVLYLMTLVWIADIGAYFSGRRFGKIKLAPGISPGKTWEGVIGGVGVNIAWMTLIYFQTDLLELNLIWFIGIGLATSAISVVGDLFESILKREAGMKDSGRILPGHGGVLDRFDSVIAATPVFLSGLFLSGAI